LGFSFDWTFKAENADFLFINGDLTVSNETIIETGFRNAAPYISATSIPFIRASNISAASFNNLKLSQDLRDLADLHLEDGTAFDRVWIYYIGGWNAFVGAYQNASAGQTVRLLRNIWAGDDGLPILAFDEPGDGGDNFTIDGEGKVANSSAVANRGFYIS
jgi:hypothetical protein